MCVNTGLRPSKMLCSTTDVNTKKNKLPKRNKKSRLANETRHKVTKTEIQPVVIRLWVHARERARGRGRWYS